ncbi:MAG: hypothetical protein DI626_06465 [Micavibrio aeruginosavorus]|uniref:Uncharacterized protein n=1 Tax=Micavibrio aeruginosavorus TaxID=349221 RepID=A0A2W5BTF6_9BACT|nr:MAG: hypothetical protein DI626_06465 [Micavibrio aeruginosavorus]
MPVRQSWVDVWNEFVPVEPAEVHAVFSRNFTGEVSAMAEIDRDCITLHVEPAEKERFSASCEFLFGGTERMREAGSSLIVQEKLRGNGIGKEWLKSLVEISVALDKESFNFQAGSVNGAYSWARMDVHVNMSAQLGPQRELQSRRMLARVDALKDFLPAADYRIARALCRMTDREDVARLARYEVPLSEDVGEVLKQANSPIYQKLEKFYEDHPSSAFEKKATAHGERYAMMQAFETAAAQGREPTLARCVLAGGMYPAVVNFSNAAQMEKIGKRVGGWTNIRPL